MTNVYVFESLKISEWQISLRKALLSASFRFLSFCGGFWQHTWWLTWNVQGQTLGLGSHFGCFLCYHCGIRDLFSALDLPRVSLVMEH